MVCSFPFKKEREGFMALKYYCFFFFFFLKIWLKRNLKVPTTKKFLKKNYEILLSLFFLVGIYYLNYYVISYLSDYSLRSTNIDRIRDTNTMGHAGISISTRIRIHWGCNIYIYLEWSWFVNRRYENEGNSQGFLFFNCICFFSFI